MQVEEFNEDQGSQVKIMQNKKTGERVLVKYYKASRLKTFDREVLNHKRLLHENIVLFYEVGPVSDERVLQSYLRARGCIEVNVFSEAWAFAGVCWWTRLFGNCNRASRRRSSERTDLWAWSCHWITSKKSLPGSSGRHVLLPWEKVRVLSNNIFPESSNTIWVMLASLAVGPFTPEWDFMYGDKENLSLCMKQDCDAYSPCAGSTTEIWSLRRYSCTWAKESHVSRLLDLATARARCLIVFARYALCTLTLHMCCLYIVPATVNLSLTFI